MEQGLAVTTPDASRRLRAAVRALVRRFAISERADVACCGMTVAQAATLEALRAGALRRGTLGQRLGVTPSTLTRNLARLEESRLVARVEDPGDRRAARVELTAAGRKAAQRVERQEEAFARGVLDLLPAERRPGVIAALNDLLQAVRQATESCCPGAFDHLMTDFPRDGGPAQRSCDESADCR